MTKAADELCIGQSGVSQHIKHLEDILEIKLFDRIKNKLIPTPNAIILYQSCSKSFYEIETSLRKLKKIETTLAGKITIGLPIEFGNNVIIPLLSEFGKIHQRVHYKIRYGYASDINDALLEGAMDFAFVDDFPFGSNISTEKVYEETLSLCSSNDYFINKKLSIGNDKDFFEALDYIKFQDNENLLPTWFKHHFKFTGMKYNIRATLMDIEGASKLITSGFGVGILPEHMVERLKNRGHSVHIFKGDQTVKELHNPISIAFVENKTLSHAALELIKFLKNKLK